MQQFVLTLKDDSKREFLVELLKRLEFVEFKVKKNGKAAEPQSEQDEISPALKDFFQSAGIWEGRDVDAKELRMKAWERST